MVWPVISARVAGCPASARAGARTPRAPRTARGTRSWSLLVCEWLLSRAWAQPTPRLAAGVGGPGGSTPHAGGSVPARMEGAEEFHGGRLIAKRPARPRRQQAVHALGRAPVLDLRRLPRGGHRDRRRPPRADRGVRRRGLGEGHARARRLRADRRSRGDQRDERARLGAAEQLADAGARRARAGLALGAGLAAGDRSRPVRAPAGEVRRDGRLAGRDPGAGRRGDRGRARRRTRGRCSSTSRSTTCSRSRPTARRRPRARSSPPWRARPARVARARAGGRAAARGRAAGDHGRDRALLGARRGARCARSPRRCGSRCSSTGWGAAACRPTTSCTSRARAAPRSRAPTSRW